MKKETHKRQFAALPFRVVDGSIEVLLITSRETGRWVIPKGWPMRGKRPHRAAAIEAYEEAGVVGKPGKKPIGRYDYNKLVAAGAVPCRVTVFPLAVDALRNEWPEMAERRREWHPADVAMDLVDEPELKSILRDVSDLVQ